MTKKKKALVIMIVSTVIVIGGSLYLLLAKQEPFQTKEKTIELSVFTQDKKAAETGDCSVTKKELVKVSENTNIADATLEFLFADELAQYGEYDSVTISGGLAKVFVKNSTLPDGRPYSALSSCEIGHLTSVTKNNLTQYGEIEFVELYSPEGKIEF